MKPLKINISEPCRANWQKMSRKEKGRFCTQCNKTVVDFENYSDNELFNYFRDHKDFCGRFKNSQLDKPILPTVHIERPSLLKSLSSKAAALFLTILSFKQSDANNPKSAHEIEKVEESNPERISDSRVLNIKIIDDLKKPVSKAAIFLDNIKIGETDDNGECTINIDKPRLKSHTLSFSKQNYRSTAVSYHPLMGNTNFAIEMWNFATVDCHVGFTMGAPRVAHLSDFNLGRIKLDNKGEPSTENKKALNILANELRSNPNVSVIFKYFFHRDKTTSIRKGHVLIDYMVNQLGIDKERFKLSIVKNKVKNQTVEVIDESDFH